MYNLNCEPMVKEHQLFAIVFEVSRFHVV